MKILKSLYLSPVRPKTAAELMNFVGDGRHQVALSTEPGKPLAIRPVAEAAIEPGLVLKAVSPNSKRWTPEQRLAVEKATVTAWGFAITHLCRFSVLKSEPQIVFS